MQYLITPKAPSIEPFVWQDKVFSDTELNWLQLYAINAKETALVGGSNNLNEVSNIRRSMVNWLRCDNETRWVFERLSDVVSSINAEWFGFDIAGFGEPIQMTNYKEENTGMYDWHQDYNSGISRKLSVVCQLTDPANYEGGELQIMTSSNPLTVKKQRGFLVVFPSYTVHRVTPVTQGNRQTLVSWVSGAPFK